MVRPRGAGVHHRPLTGERISPLATARVAEGGTRQHVYSLTEPGFELARGRRFSGQDEISRDAT
jgi:hypothetical protein